MDIFLIAAVAGIIGAIATVIGLLKRPNGDNKNKELIHNPDSLISSSESKEQSKNQNIHREPLLQSETDVKERTTSFIPEQKAILGYSEEAKESHKLYVNFCQQYTQKQGIPSRLKNKAINENTLLYPTISLDSNYVDCICSVITTAATTIAIIPSLDSEPDVEGVGRTSIILRLLGITIPYGRLLGLDNDSMKKLDEITIFPPSEIDYHLLASDTAYIGNSGGELSIVPTNGEEISFSWDIARHIFRQTELEYHTGDHRKECNRDKLLAIFNRIPILKKFYGSLERPSSIEEIYVLQRKIGSPLSPKKRVITGDERKKLLRKALLVSSKHGSDFWKRDKNELEIRVDNILNAINWNKVSEVVELVVQHPDSDIPDYVYDELKDIIIHKPLRSEPKLESIKTGVGIRYHNDILIKAIHEVNELAILVTSGEHLFKDVSFWKNLSKSDEEINLRLLLLDPKSKAADKREKLYVNKNDPKFFHKELEENILTIKRMSEYFKKIGKKINIECKLYGELPSFRMTFIGKKRLIIAPYSEKNPTSPNTIFYDIKADQDMELFNSFRKEFERIESNSISIL